MIISLIEFNKILMVFFTHSNMDIQNEITKFFVTFCLGQREGDEEAR